MFRANRPSRQRRAPCLWPETAYEPTACPSARPSEQTDWSSETADRLQDFAEELSDELLPHLSAIADEHGFVAITADLVDATGALSAKLVLAEPRCRRPQDTLGLIVLPPGAQAGEAIVFPRTRA